MCAPREEFSVATLALWDWSYRANELEHSGTVRENEIKEYEPGSGTKLIRLDAPLHVWLTSLYRSRYPLDEVWEKPERLEGPRRSALVWRRHPSHPCVQVLPLTQNAVPANALSPSRQLVPFSLKLQVVPFQTPDGKDNNYLAPVDWRFRSLPADFALRAVGGLTADADWKANPRLALALLGLPGAALAVASSSPVAAIPDTSAFLDRALYRHDLPVLDQPNALADVPPEKRAGNSPPPPPKVPPEKRAGDSPPLPPKALLRRDYARHWSLLEGKAVFAEIDEAEAALSTDGGVAVRGLMEPRKWPAKLQIDWSGFPGSHAFVDRSDPTLKLRLMGDDPQEDALRGFDGYFDITGAHLKLSTNSSAPIQMVAGAFTATVESTATGRKLRDQRRLLRGETAAGASLLTTPLTLNTSAGDQSRILCTMVNPISLNVAGKTWLFWVKDLPAQGSGPFSFERSETLSEARRGVNDPAAEGRDLGHLNAYEWRLGIEPVVPDRAWLPIGPFRFYPLSLEKAVLTADSSVVSGEFVGRLQLPAWDSTPDGQPADRELGDRDSAVVLTFTDNMLTGIARALADPDFGSDIAQSSAAWPLVDRRLDTDAPVLYWDAIEFQAGKIVLPKKKYRLVYSRQGIVWTIVGDKDIHVPPIKESARLLQPITRFRADPAEQRRKLRQNRGDRR